MRLNGLRIESVKYKSLELFFFFCFFSLRTEEERGGEGGGPIQS
jgi:hypothetical protein